MMLPNCTLIMTVTRYLWHKKQSVQIKNYIDGFQLIKINAVFVPEIKDIKLIEVG